MIQPTDFADLLVSSAALESPEGTLDDVHDWWKRLDAAYAFQVERIPFSALTDWSFDEHRNIRHASGKYFSVRGVRVRTNYGTKPEWAQPIIVQPEIGILGILAQKRHGVWHFLMQAKMEPGNVNKLQLSPTVQATKSNYTRVHGGSLPPYLEYFASPGRARVVVDQLQSEQGARFFRKRNRNVVLLAPEGAEVPALENFRWLTLGQIRALMRADNLVNMNTRSVLSCVQPPHVCGVVQDRFRDPWEHDVLASLLPGPDVSSDEEIISWFTGLKCLYELDAALCGIDELADWRVGDDAISHAAGKYFDVIAVRARVDAREVRSWTQPMVQQREPGIAGFLAKKFGGRLHLLVQAKLEVGNHDVLEMAPTVQCLTGSYRRPEYPVPFLDVFERRAGTVRFDTLLSEEGGRFYREENRYMMIEVDGEVEVPPRFTWVSYGQAKEFIKFNNYFNVEARTLVACTSVL